MFNVHPTYIKSMHISSIDYWSHRDWIINYSCQQCNGNGVESSKFYYSLSIVMIFDIHSIRSQSMTCYCVLNCVCIHPIWTPSIPCNANYDRPLKFWIAKTSACRPGSDNAHHMDSLEKQLLRWLVNQKASDDGHLNKDARREKLLKDWILRPFPSPW